MNIKSELKELIIIVKSLKKKAVIIFFSIAILQTISWYYTSRKFFRANFFDSLQYHSDVYLWEYLYWFGGDFITLFIIPLLIIKLLFKEKIKDYGIFIGDIKSGIKLTLLFFLIMIPLVWFSSSLTEFSGTYPLLSSAKDSWRVFIIFEAGLLFYIAAWEFIWRGFMLFGLKNQFGYYAVLLQMIPFVILHNGKPVLETFGSIIAALALGILALRTRSIYYCVITHAGVMFSIDLISTLRSKTQDYGTGIDSFINIFLNSWNN